MANERLLVAVKATSGAPSPSTLDIGEQCWVIPDGVMFIKDTATTVAQVGGSSPTHQQDTFWAEENGGIAANQDEYSWGNGATGNIGLPIPYDGFEATALLINAETSGTSAVIMLRIGGATTSHTVTFTQGDQVIALPSPVAIAKGSRIGFRTVAVIGTWSDVRVGVVGRFPLLTI